MMSSANKKPNVRVPTVDDALGANRTFLCRLFIWDVLCVRAF